MSESDKYKIANLIEALAKRDVNGTTFNTNVRAIRGSDTLIYQGTTMATGAVTNKLVSAVYDKSQAYDALTGG